MKLFELLEEGPPANGDRTKLRNEYTQTLKEIVRHESEIAKLEKKHVSLRISSNPLTLPKPKSLILIKMVVCIGTAC